MSSTAVPPNYVSPQTLSELSEVKGMLAVLLQTIQQNHVSTNLRLDDLRHSIDQRFTGVDDRMDRIEERLERVEENERKTAIKTAAAGAASGALVSAGVAAAKMMMGG